MSNQTLAYLPIYIGFFLYISIVSCQKKLWIRLCHENGCGMKDKLLICFWHEMITLFWPKGFFACTKRDCVKVASSRKKEEIVYSKRGWLCFTSKLLLQLSLAGWKVKQGALKPLLTNGFLENIFSTSKWFLHSYLINFIAR